MKNRVDISRRHSESGRIAGKINGRRIEYSWNSHELWINGRCNPEDHPLEEVAQELFETLEEHIKTIAAINADTDIHEIPFEAIILDGEIVDFAFVVKIRHDDAKTATVADLIKELGVTTKSEIRIIIDKERN